MPPKSRLEKQLERLEEKKESLEQRGKIVPEEVVHRIGSLRIQQRPEVDPGKHPGGRR